MYCRAAPPRHCSTATASLQPQALLSWWPSRAPSLLASSRDRCCRAASGRSLAAPRAQRPGMCGAQGFAGTQAAPAARKHTACPPAARGSRLHAFCMCFCIWLQALAGQACVGPPSAGGAEMLPGTHAAYAAWKHAPAAIAAIRVRGTLVIRHHTYTCMSSLSIRTGGSKVWHCGQRTAVGDDGWKQVDRKRIAFLHVLHAPGPAPAARPPGRTRPHHPRRSARPCTCACRPAPPPGCPAACLRARRCLDWTCQTEGGRVQRRERGAAQDATRCAAPEMCGLTGAHRPNLAV
jgi:hypothetical protein